MRRRHVVGTLALCAGLPAGLAAPTLAHADTSGDEFLSALTNAGLALPDSADPVAVGQSVCPMLSAPGQTTADAAASVAKATGMSLGPATMFTGLAISIFCPAAVASIATGASPVPASIPASIPVSILGVNSGLLTG